MLPSRSVTRPQQQTQGLKYSINVCQLPTKVRWWWDSQLAFWILAIATVLRLQVVIYLDKKLYLRGLTMFWECLCGAWEFLEQSYKIPF